MLKESVATAVATGKRLASALTAASKLLQTALPRVPPSAGIPALTKRLSAANDELANSLDAGEVAADASASLRIRSPPAT